MLLVQVGCCCYKGRRVQGALCRYRLVGTVLPPGVVAGDLSGPLAGGVFVWILAACGVQVPSGVRLRALSTNYAMHGEMDTCQ